jgi:hypothetical protein
LKVVYFSIFLRIEDASNCYVGEHKNKTKMKLIIKTQTM